MQNSILDNLYDFFLILCSYLVWQNKNPFSLKILKCFLFDRLVLKVNQAPTLTHCLDGKKIEKKEKGEEKIREKRRFSFVWLKEKMREKRKYDRKYK